MKLRLSLIRWKVPYLQCRLWGTDRLNDYRNGSLHRNLLKHPRDDARVYESNQQIARSILKIEERVREVAEYKWEDKKR